MYEPVHSTAAGPLCRDISPAHVLAQDVNDAPQSRPVVRGQPLWIPMTPHRPGRQ